MATKLDSSNQRKYIGNNKVNIIFLDGEGPIEAEFRGSVNSLHIVVQKSKNTYKLGCFYRRRLIDFNPFFPNSEIPCKDILSVNNPNFHLIRDFLFINVVNGLIQIKR